MTESKDRRANRSVTDQTQSLMQLSYHMNILEHSFLPFLLRSDHMCPRSARLDAVYLSSTSYYIKEVL